MSKRDELVMALCDAYKALNESENEWLIARWALLGVFKTRHTDKALDTYDREHPEEVKK
jgi:hypothetical protein